MTSPLNLTVHTLESRFSELKQLQSKADEATNELNTYLTNFENSPQFSEVEYNRLLDCARFSIMDVEDFVARFEDGLVTLSINTFSEGSNLSVSRNDQL